MTDAKQILSFAILVSFLIAGCATVPTAPALSVDHPANPNAPEAPPAQPSKTLDAYWTPASLKFADKPDDGDHVKDTNQHLPDRRKADKADSNRSKRSGEADHSDHH